VAPTPTDGWVPSTVTLAEDRLPLTAADLDGWLWRIHQTTHLLIQRAAGLANDALDWQPPDGGWTLRRVLHHVARSELLYAGCRRSTTVPDPPSSPPLVAGRWPESAGSQAAPRQQRFGRGEGNGLGLMVDYFNRVDRRKRARWPHDTAS
jgi:hypothetical protein